MKCIPIVAATFNAPEFWSFILVGGPDECWLWQGVIDRNGCGRWHRHKHHYFASRIAFVLSGRTLGTDQCVRHTCDNPPCCNPKHLISGTQLDNVADRFERHRCAAGERHPKAKLTADQVVQIRALYVPRIYTLAKLAKQFGMSLTAITDIVSGKHWKSFSLETKNKEKG